ncbi:MAG TPA: zinc-ribbon domain-containing protein, partial [Anaeromyxobacteraceae bacterium]|nr:zinc-ribbon domain-containing protein [Anaeromyxobacteraceae bacterium]
MNVRCERCRAEQAIADEAVGAGGLDLRCPTCGYVTRLTRKARPPGAADERGGPVVSGELAPVAEERWEAPGEGRAAGTEPAWARGTGSAPLGPESPAGRKVARRGSVWPKLIAAVVALSAAAAVVLAKPAWLGLGPVVVPPSEVPVAKPTATATAKPKANATAKPTAPSPPPGEGGRAGVRGMGAPAP